MLTRRAFGAALAPAVLRAQRKDRPNILFFFADDWARCASAYRDPSRASWNDVVRTPNIDRVAREGVLFTNAFMCTPSCTPSRASVATGCYSWRCGSAANLRGGSWRGRHDPADDLPGAGTLLEKSDYHVSARFKTIQQRWIGRRPDRNREFLRYSQHVSPAASAAERETLRRQVLQQARDSIGGVLRDRAAGQPFFHVFGPMNAHRPWVWQSGSKLWGIDPEALKGRIPAFLPDIPVVRQDVADYLGEVQALDALLGCFLEELERTRELDRTLVVLTGDNGMGGMPHGKCNLYDFGVAAPLMMRWPEYAKAGRVADEFVSLMDLAPTFLEAGGAAAPAGIDGRSLLPLLQGAGRDRDFVVTCRERHVGDARAGSLPYPSRAIRTRDFLYIENLKPERWPMGDATGADEKMSYEELAASRELLTYKDMDASPTKAWILKNRKEQPKWFEFAFGRRPAAELYDLRRDPDQVRNVAADTGYAAEKSRLAAKLLAVRRGSRDPRLDDAFDRPPYVEE